MSDDNLPPEAAFMSVKALDRAQRVRTYKRQDAEKVTRLGPRALTPAEGIVEPTAWLGDVPNREWIVQHLIPAAQVCMINGNGGEGKSLVGAQLATAAVAGFQWMGRRVNSVRSVIVHCEDDEVEMRRRIEGILRAEKMDVSCLDGLTLIDRDDQESSLLYEVAHPNDMGGRFTPFFEQIYETIRQLGAQLLILDSLYNFFGGNENIRSQVTEFIGGLKRMAKQLNCAIVIIAHPGRAGMGEGGDGTSGSTAWHNAVRSRFYIHRKKHPSGDKEKKGPLIFDHVKSNYGQRQLPMEIIWVDGRFIPCVDPTPDPPPISDAPPSEKQWDLI